ncbi:hypothetical protein LCGC14_1038680 [marine sediment metagenome]|uniref:Uncharacterized protein n=1 Tax=marine sediment metagenome TaxID=412755 RepID=A0A0F9MSF7_9ZZZZ
MDEYRKIYRIFYGFLALAFPLLGLFLFIKYYNVSYFIGSIFLSFISKVGYSINKEKRPSKKNSKKENRKHPYKKTRGVRK